MAPTKRKPELIWLNVAFFAMVIWSHCSSHPIGALDRQSWQFAVVYLLQRLTYVSVYGFFFISGIKLTLPRSRVQSLGAYWGSRVKTIFLPYLLAVAIYYYWFVACLHYFPPSLSHFVGYLLRGDLSSHFYFVIALAQFVLLAPVFRWVSQHCSAVLLLPFVLGLSWFSAQYLGALLQVIWSGLSFPYSDRVFLTYSFYYLAGCYAGRRYEEFVELIRSNGRLISLLFACCAIPNLLLCWLNFTGRRYISFLEPVHMLYILSAVLFCYWVALRLPEAIPRWLLRVDRASYLIYLYHSLFIFIFNEFARRVGIVRVSQQFVLRLLFVYLCTPLVCVGWQSLRAKIVPPKKK